MRPPPDTERSRSPVSSRVPFASNRQTATYNLLVADDNRDMAETFAALVRMSGHTVQVAYDGEDALRLALLQPIDIAVLDIEMPKLNGYEVARRLRAVNASRQLVLIAVTGWTRETERAAARAAGFDAFLMKPLDYSDFERLVQALPGAR